MASPRQLLQQHGLRPKHSWGQNFLGDPDVLRRIAAEAELRPGEPVIELGAGLGHLTRELAATGARVVAVERDRDLVQVLESERLPGVRVVAANAADVRFAELAGAEELTVVGNLPYHLTSPILFEILDQRTSVRCAVLTLQQEVVERIATPVGQREAGVLSALLQLYFEVERLFDVPARLFHPPPKVGSAVVRLRRLPRPRAEVRSDDRFRRVVKAAFAQRRKTLRNAWKGLPGLTPEGLAAAAAAAGVSLDARGETLDVAAFSRMADEVARAHS